MTLKEFADSWLASPIVRPPLAAIDKAAENTGMTLYRDDRFQVQLWQMPPNTTVTDHSHPDIDSWLVRVSGKLRIRINGRWMSLSEFERTEWLGMRTWYHHVRPNDSHGVVSGPPGGSFLSINERTDGAAPVSVHQNWAGDALDAEHAKVLGVF